MSGIVSIFILTDEYIPENRTINVSSHTANLFFTTKLTIDLTYTPILS